MVKISPLSVIVAYDIADDERRDDVVSYLETTLNAERYTESVFEFAYSGNPLFDTILKAMRGKIVPAEGDKIFAWDYDSGLRRIAVHELKRPRS